MKREFRNWSEFYQRISFLFNAIIAFTLLPFGWVYLELVEEESKEAIIGGDLLWVFNALFLSGVAIVLYLAQQQFVRSMKSLSKSQSIRSKLKAYYTFSIRKYVFNEFAAILALVATYLSQQILFAIVYIFILFIFSLSRPKFDRVVQQLSLSKEEEEILAKSDELPED